MRNPFPRSLLLLLLTVVSLSGSQAETGASGGSFQQLQQSSDIPPAESSLHRQHQHQHQQYHQQLDSSMTQGTTNEIRPEKVESSGNDEGEGTLKSLITRRLSSDSVVRMMSTEQRQPPIETTTTTTNHNNQGRLRTMPESEEEQRDKQLISDWQNEQQQELLQQIEELKVQLRLHQELLLQSSTRTQQQQQQQPKHPSPSTSSFPKDQLQGSWYPSQQPQPQQNPVLSTTPTSPAQFAVVTANMTEQDVRVASGLATGILGTLLTGSPVLGGVALGLSAAYVATSNADIGGSSGSHSMSRQRQPQGQDQQNDQTMLGFWRDSARAFGEVAWFLHYKAREIEQKYHVWQTSQARLHTLATRLWQEGQRQYYQRQGHGQQQHEQGLEKSGDDGGSAAMTLVSRLSSLSSSWVTRNAENLRQSIARRHQKQQGLQSWILDKKDKVMPRVLHPRTDEEKENAKKKIILNAKTNAEPMTCSPCRTTTTAAASLALPTNKALDQ